MINLLDNLIRDVLLSTEGTQPAPVVPTVTAMAQIGFQSPDADWRTAVALNSPANAINVCLVDIRENRRMWSNERGIFPLAGRGTEDCPDLKKLADYLGVTPAEADRGRPSPKRGSGQSEVED